MEQNTDKLTHSPTDHPQSMVYPGIDVSMPTSQNEEEKCVTLFPDRKLLEFRSGSKYTEHSMVSKTARVCYLKPRLSARKSGADWQAHEPDCSRVPDVNTTPLQGQSIKSAPYPDTLSLPTPCERELIEMFPIDVTGSCSKMPEDLDGQAHNPPPKFSNNPFLTT